MKAIEFVAKAKNGSIEVPKQYVDMLKNKVKVIILVEEEKPVLTKKRQLTAVRMKTKGFNFNREEANER
jgi:hypothetical protein